MLFLLAMMVALAVVVLCQKSIKKDSNAYYVIALLIVIFTSVLDFSSSPAWMQDWFIAVFQRGTFATALWVIVMWTGALSNGSKAMKTFMPVRGELSILATIFTIGHNLTFGKTYFVRMFMAADKMTVTQLAAGYFSIIMLIIIIPLAIMSVPKVRRRMKAFRWKKYQKFAYLFYLLLYAHVMVLMVPMAQKGSSKYAINVMVYSIVFLGYAVCRIRKWYVIKKKPQSEVLCNIAGIVSYCAMLAVAFGLTRHSAMTDNNKVVIAENISEAEITGLEVFPEFTEEQPMTEMYMESIVQSVAEATTAHTEIVVAEETITEQETTVFMATEPVRMYRDGNYTATALGFDGMIEVTLTIQDDRIISVKGSSTESDSWYYESASDVLLPQIVATQNMDLDAVSGATYSSEGILNAAKDALKQARN